MITDYERLLWVLAEEMESSIYSCFQKVQENYEWVDNHEEAKSLERRFIGIFIASLVGEIEEQIGDKFSSVFSQLSDIPTPKNSTYWFEDMPESSTPRGRAKVMWAIRIAYTHGNGNISQIGDSKIADYLKPEFVNKHFQDVEVKHNIVQELRKVPHVAIKTVVEIKETLISQ